MTRRQLHWVGLIVLAMASSALAVDWPKWRGPNGDMKSTETGLLKSWPATGPKLLWTMDGLGKGYSSVAIAGGTIYTTGMLGNDEFLFAGDLNGKLKWKKAYGPAYKKSYPSARTTPTVDSGMVYVISSLGNVCCFDASSGAKKWAVDTKKDFGVGQLSWGLAESPLVVDDKVICTPGGPRGAIVALDKKTGKTRWAMTAVKDKSAYCTPLLVKRGKRQLLVQVLSKHIVGVDAASGKLLWKHPYENKYSVHPNTPIVAENLVYVTSGYNHKGVALKLSADGSSVTKAWEDQTLDTHHGNVVCVNGYVYGASWKGNANGKWVCLNLKTGQASYETSWINKGSLTYADGMLYCYEEKMGTMALVKATPTGFNPISTFKVKHGSDKHWGHPVVCGGRLYIRHGDVLMAYDIKGS